MELPFQMGHSVAGRRCYPHQPPRRLAPASAILLAPSPVSCRLEYQFQVSFGLWTTPGKFRRHRTHRRVRVVTARMDERLLAVDLVFHRIHVSPQSDYGLCESASVATTPVSATPDLTSPQRQACGYVCRRSCAPRTALGC